METLRSGPNSGFSRSFQLRHFTASDSSKTRANARAFQQVPADTKTCWQLCQAGDARILVTAKWSVRADREEQFMSDFQAYERLESAGRDFGYVLITNEFDAARLRAARARSKSDDREPNTPQATGRVRLLLARNPAPPTDYRLRITAQFAAPSAPGTTSPLAGRPFPPKPRQKTLRFYQIQVSRHPPDPR